MPTRKPWDHTINLKEDFIPRKGQIYLLSRTEKEEVQAFIESQLEKGYIRPSKSLQTSPVLFIPKKDRKRRIVQDYHYVNKGTIKNSYPLPLISELLAMGLQQHPNQERERIEGSIHDVPRIVQANSNVLYTYKLISYFPSHNE